MIIKEDCIQKEILNNQELYKGRILSRLYRFLGMKIREQKKIGK